LRIALTELRKRLILSPICSVPSKLPGFSSQLAESTPKLKPNSPRKKHPPDAAKVALGGTSKIWRLTNR
jgi:hypothetical protein